LTPDVNALSDRRGAFVTLRSGGELRGCIGHIAADRPLGDVVARMAVAAATEDPRFPAVVLAELAELHIEISVLTAPQPLRDRDVTQIVPGRDGLVVQRGGRQGLLLPQVATEYGWDAEELLAATCHKAGFAQDAWRDPKTEILVFRAEVFGE
jgi:AmmeMemoRadiSam system protein A